jgi:hypothetical protein
VPPPPATPSQALQEWNATRCSKLDKLDAQCVLSASAVPPDPDLVSEQLRAFVTLLSAHFQGFCRDLYTEAGFIVVQRLRQVGLKPIVQAQITAGLKLAHGNPTLSNLTVDFARFGIVKLNTVVGTDTVATQHKQRLEAMNDCRNKCAHGEPTIPELSLANIRNWRQSCDWLASRLNTIVYDRLWAAFRTVPW